MSLYEKVFKVKKGYAYIKQTEENSNVYSFSKYNKYGQPVSDVELISLTDEEQINPSKSIFDRWMEVEYRETNAKNFFKKNERVKSYTTEELKKISDKEDRINSFLDKIPPIKNFTKVNLVRELSLIESLLLDKDMGVVIKEALALQKNLKMAKPKEVMAWTCATLDVNDAIISSTSDVSSHYITSKKIQNGILERFLNEQTPVLAKKDRGAYLKLCNYLISYNSSFLFSNEDTNVAKEIIRNNMPSRYNIKYSTKKNEESVTENLIEDIIKFGKENNAEVDEEQIANFIASGDMKNALLFVQGIVDSVPQSETKVENDVNEAIISEGERIIAILAKESTKPNTLNWAEVDAKDLTVLSPNQINQLILKGLDEIDFEDNEDRNKLLRIISDPSLKNHSDRNKFLVALQSFHKDGQNVFYSMKEANEQGLVVKEGEKGYSICVPLSKVVYEKKYNKREWRIVEDSEQDTVDGSKEYELEIMNGTMRKRSHVDYTYQNSLFSLSQMKQNKSLQSFISNNILHEGDDSNCIKAFEQLSKVINSAGISISEVDTISASNVSNGDYVVNNNHIEILRSAPTDAKVQILAHELSHYLLHKQDYVRNSNSNYFIDKNRKERQAHIAASLICMGLKVKPESINTFPYIAAYLGMEENENTNVLFGNSSNTKILNDIDISLKGIAPVIKALTQLNSKEINEKAYDRAIKEIVNFRPNSILKNKTTDGEKVVTAKEIQAELLEQQKLEMEKNQSNEVEKVKKAHQVQQRYKSQVRTK